MNNEQIMLIDAYAQIYRSFYAIRDLANSKGIPTNAVFGITKFLLKMNKNYPSNYGAFAFDIGKPAFRMEIAPDYKANRPPMPDELKQQTPIIREVVQAFGWPILEKENYEADDILAALAKHFSDYSVLIVSSDKDIAQVINEKVKMLIPNVKGGGFSLRGPEEVLEKFSVKPEQIVDYLALIGDSSDNIPGVQGVGPKTAAKLINEFGSIDALLEKADGIANEKLRDKIKNATDILHKNRELITLKCEIPDEAWKLVDSIKRSAPDWQKLADICRDLELKSVLKEIEENSDNLFSSQSTEPKKEEPQAYTPDLFDM